MSFRAAKVHRSIGVKQNGNVTDPLPCTVHMPFTYIMVVEHGEDGGIVIGHHETGAVKPLGLMDQHVATLVVSVIGHYYSG